MFNNLHEVESLNVYQLPKGPVFYRVGSWDRQVEIEFNRAPPYQAVKVV